MSGAELAFIIFPIAIDTMPFKNLWAIIFYFMMLNLGIDTMFGFFENISVTIEEFFNHKRYILRFILIGCSTIMGSLFCFGNGF
jgi:SNF family Na+-dependent transporter